MFLQVYVCVHVCVFACLCVCVSVCVYDCVCLYTREPVCASCLPSGPPSLKGATDPHHIQMSKSPHSAQPGPGALSPLS